MCMFHVSQSSLSIVTIASVLLSSQVFRQFGTRSGLQGGGGGREGKRGGCRVLFVEVLVSVMMTSVFVNRYTVCCVLWPATGQVWKRVGEITFLAHGWRSYSRGFWRHSNGTWSLTQARFKRRATAVRNSVALIKFDFSTAEARRRGYTAVARLGFKRRATAMPNSIHKLQIH